MKGRLIVIYGVNNLGKSTQARLLVENLNKDGFPTEYIKYPMYDIDPSGILINEFLRGGNPHNFSSREMQILNVLNRTQYQPELQEMLNRGINIVAEDYVGGGMAWGMGAGIDKGLLIHLNSHLIKADLEFLFDGRRFEDGIEKGHTHEENNELVDRVQQAYKELADDFGYIRVDANRTIETIQQELLSKIRALL